jgi:hypothetical protein
MATTRCTTSARSLLYLANPPLWPAWPFLPVVRRSRGREELGVMFDARAAGLTGYSATVFIGNLFALPATLAEFLALDREVFDTGEELLAAGWSVD